MNSEPASRNVFNFLTTILVPDRTDCLFDTKLSWQGLKKRPEPSNTPWSSEIRRTTKLIQNQVINQIIYVNLETWSSPFKHQRVVTRKAWGQEVTESSLMRVPTAHNLTSTANNMTGLEFNFLLLQRKPRLHRPPLLTNQQDPLEIKKKKKVTPNPFNQTTFCQCFSFGHAVWPNF